MPRSGTRKRTPSAVYGMRAWSRTARWRMSDVRARFLSEVARARLPSHPGPVAAVADAELARLPEPAQRYLRFMGAVGRPQDWSFRLEFAGRFRLKPGQAWMACRTWQYNSRPAIARIFQIRIRMAGV